MKKVIEKRHDGVEVQKLSTKNLHEFKNKATEILKLNEVESEIPKFECYSEEIISLIFNKNIKNFAFHIKSFDYLDKDMSFIDILNDLEDITYFDFNIHDSDGVIEWEINFNAF